MKILFRFWIVVFTLTLEFEKRESNKIKLFFEKLKDKIKKTLKKKKKSETRFNVEQEVVEPLRRSTREVVQLCLRSATSFVFIKSSPG